MMRKHDTIFIAIIVACSFRMFFPHSSETNAQDYSDSLGKNVVIPLVAPEEGGVASRLKAILEASPRENAVETLQYIYDEVSSIMSTKISSSIIYSGGE